MFSDPMPKLWIRPGTPGILGEFADNLAGGVEELKFGRTVWCYAKDEAIASLGVF